MSRRSPAVAAFLAALHLAPAAASPSVEYQVKSAILYYLAKFTDWPASKAKGPGDAFQLCIYGQDPFGRDVDRIVEGKRIHDRPIAMRRPSRIEELESCDALFVSTSERGQLARILGAVAEHNVLTVGEMPEFTQSAGMVKFFIDQNKVAMEINLQAVERANLRISSQVLKIARVTR